MEKFKKYLLEDFYAILLSNLNTCWWPNFVSFS